MRRYLTILAAFTIIALGACGMARAQAFDTSTPDGTVKSIVAGIMTDLSAGRPDRDGVSATVTRRFVPYFDFHYASRLAMGRAWREATPEQQRRIIEQFTPMLIRNFSGVFSQAFESADYKPLRMSRDESEAIVHSKLVGGGKATQIDYRLTKTHYGWRIYDVDAMGAWLVETYKQQFAEQVRQHGLDGMIEFLVQRNQKFAGGR